MPCGLEADEPEWLGPEAGHDEQIGAREERIDPVLSSQPVKSMRTSARVPPMSAAAACQAARAGPSPTNVTSSLRLSAPRRAAARREGSLRPSDGSIRPTNKSRYSS